MHMLQRSLFPLEDWLLAAPLFGPSARPSSWRPAFDLNETDEAFVLRGDVPGVAQEDIEVRFEDDVLTVRGERKPVEDDDGNGRTERIHGKFERSYRLGDTIDAEGIKASYANGVLELTLPKREPVDNSRLIPVN